MDIDQTRQQAERGDAEAQFDLGRHYYADSRERQDYAEAVKWLRQAAAQGHAGARSLLCRIQILAHAEGLPEGAPIVAKGLLHLGKRAAVDTALSRLAGRGQLLRASRGLYFRPVSSRFGKRAPLVELALRALARQRGEVIVPSGAAAANALGLTTQVPIRSVYLTSGRNRKMRLGQQVVELRHAPHWQLNPAGQAAGQAVRALAWLGPQHAQAALKKLKRRLPSSAFAELAAITPQLPAWLALSISKATHV